MIDSASLMDVELYMLWMAWNPLLDRLLGRLSNWRKVLWMAWNPLLDRLYGDRMKTQISALDGLESAS